MEASAQESVFYENIGRAVSAFGRVEICLCNHFALIGQIEPVVARVIFNSARSVRGKLDMFDALLSNQGSAVGLPSLFPFLKLAAGRIGMWSSTRNLLAHGSVAKIEMVDSKFNGQYIIVDSGSRDWPNPKKSLTRAQVEIATSNFGVLSSLLLAGYNSCSPPTEATLKECHALTEMLPKKAVESIALRDFSKRLGRILPDGEHPFNLA